MQKIAKPGDFCSNEACPNYGKLQTGELQNLKKAGKTKEECSVINARPAA